MKIKKLTRGFFRENVIYLLLLLFISLFYMASASLNLLEEVKPAIESGSLIKAQTDLPSEEGLRKLFAEGNIYAIGLYGIGTLLILGFLAGIGLDLVFVVLKFKGKEVIPRSFIMPEAGWQAMDIVRIIILYLFFSCLINCAFAASRYIFFIESLIVAVGKLDELSRLALSLSVSYILIISLLVYFIVVKYKYKIEVLGLSVKGFFKNVFLGAAGYIALIPLLTLSAYVSLLLASFFNIGPEENPLLNVFQTEGRPALVAYFVICICFLGPVVEEIFFRGFLYKALRKSFGVLPAVAVSSVFFAWLHMTFIGFLPIMVLGLLLAYLYEKNGTLIPSITVHIIHNSAIIIFVMIFKGLGS
ncbi:MAG: CPBP family intramembrane metalloprotease [Candidatus Omnitrophica bacterium]|nr:CPBP family intramembrane metalloprotease [Candidatus Omnitrophota bacterium]